MSIALVNIRVFIFFFTKDERLRVEIEYTYKFEVQGMIMKKQTIKTFGGLCCTDSPAINDLFTWRWGNPSK